jgi:hypothetical protein
MFVAETFENRDMQPLIDAVNGIETDLWDMERQLRMYDSDDIRSVSDAINLESIKAALEELTDKFGG